jgi:hypothetical protein
MSDLNTNFNTNNTEVENEKKLSKVRDSVHTEPSIVEEHNVKIAGKNTNKIKEKNEKRVSDSHELVDFKAEVKGKKETKQNSIISFLNFICDKIVRFFSGAGNVSWENALEIALKMAIKLELDHLTAGKSGKFEINQDSMIKKIKENLGRSFDALVRDGHLNSGSKGKTQTKEEFVKKYTLEKFEELRGNVELVLKFLNFLGEQANLNLTDEQFKDEVYKFSKDNPEFEGKAAANSGTGKFMSGDSIREEQKGGKTVFDISSNPDTQEKNSVDLKWYMDGNKPNEKGKKLISNLAEFAENVNRSIKNLS